MYMYRLSEEEYNALTIPTTLKAGTLLCNHEFGKAIYVVTDTSYIYKKGEEPDNFAKYYPGSNSAFVAMLAGDGTWIKLNQDLSSLTLCDNEQLMYREDDKIHNALIDAYRAASEFFIQNEKFITASYAYSEAIHESNRY